MKKRKKKSFRDWVRAYGIRRLARDLNLDQTTPSKWANGKTLPGGKNRAAVLALAKGEVTAEDLLGGAR